MILKLIAIAFGAWLLALFLFHKLYKTKPVVFHTYSILFPCTIAALYMAFMRQAPPPSQDYAQLPLEQSIATEPTDTKNWADAERALRNNLLDDPHDIDLIKDLSGNLIAQEKFTEAAELLNKELNHQAHEELQLQLTVALFAHGLYMAEHKNYDKALTLLHRAKNNAPQSAPFLADIDVFLGVIKKEIDKSAQNEPDREIKEVDSDTQTDATAPDPTTEE